MSPESTMTLVDEQPLASPDVPVASETTPEAPTSAEPTPETPAAPAPTPEEPKEPRFQRRINQLTRKIHDLERQLGAPQPSAPIISPSAQEQEPQEADFADYGQYVRALTRWETRQAQQETLREAETRREQERIANLSRDFAPQMEAAREKYDDFDEVVSQPIFTPLAQELLWHSPQGAEIAYYLGTHPQEAATLNSLSPLAAARRLVALETQIQQAAVQPKTVSMAPAPIAPVAGTPASVKDPDKMTTEEWMAWDKQQRIERLKTRPF